MKAKPILFSAPMIRALIREVQQPGTGKTQTRRTLKPQPEAHPGWDCTRLRFKTRAGVLRGDAATNGQAACFTPFAIGDVLWARETWTARMTHGWTIADARSRMYQEEILYKADNSDAIHGWWPSIHMPRDFSRLTLEVTDVRVERLQDISEADAIAEGIEDVTSEVAPRDKSLRYWKRYMDGGCNGYVDNPIGSYASLWTEINGAGAWDANPWVVAVTYRPHLINVDAFLAQRVAA